MWGREGKGREGKGREGKGREGKGWATGQVVDNSFTEMTFKLLRDRNVVGVFKT